MAAEAGNISSARANGSSLAWVHTLGSGSDLVLIVGVAFEVGAAPVSGDVVWDSDGVNEALTLLPNTRTDSPYGSEIWYLVNPSAATGSSEISYTAQQKEQISGCALTVTGAGTPVDGIAESNNEGAFIFVSNVTADDILFDVVGGNTNLVLQTNHNSVMDESGGPNHWNASWKDGQFDGNMIWGGGTHNHSQSACRIPAAPLAAVRVPLIMAPYQPS